MNWPFLTSASVLASVAIGLPWAAEALRVALTKKPIPLRRPLSQLDRTRLAPYRFISVSRLDPNVEQALGTEEYIFWTLRDSTLDSAPHDPRAVVHLAVTYYTGKPDPVPHTPDVCFLGSGYQIQRAVNTTIEIRLGAETVQVPIRAVTFVKSSLLDLDELTVVYTFHCNGQFAAGRNTVRRIVNRPFDDYAYYSKVEVSFGGPGSQPAYPSAEATVDAAGRLLSRVLPLLIAEHWPDWDAAESAETGSGSANGANRPAAWQSTDRPSATNAQTHARRARSARAA